MTLSTPSTLPHLKFDDHAGDYVVQWPNLAGDDHKPDGHFPSVSDAAKEMRFQMYFDCTIGGETNARDVVYHMSNGGARA